MPETTRKPRTLRWLEKLHDQSDRWARRLLAVEIDARLTREERQLLDGNRQFLQRHSGKRAFVLATGPSLAAQDLSPLSTEITFAVNSFWRHAEMGRWQPTYFLLTDGLLFSGKED